MQFTGIKIQADKTTKLDVDMSETALTMEQDIIIVGDKPLVEVDENTKVKEL